MWQISELFSQPKVLIPDIKGSEHTQTTLDQLICHNQHFSNVSVQPVLCFKDASPE